MTAQIVAGIACGLVFSGSTVPSLIRYSYRKVGGIRFLRINRLQLSFCVCKKGI